MRHSFRSLGFTIVELATVVAVIGILALISVTAYGGWRERAATTELKSDLKAVSIAMENARNFGSGYPTSIPTTFTSSKNVQVTYIDGDSTQYCIQATSLTVTSLTFYINSNDQREPVKGTCAGGPSSGPAASGQPITWSSVSVSGSGACATTDSSTSLVYCWGNGYILGDGSSVYSSYSAVPVPVTTSGQLSNKSITATASGSNSACALASGKVYCWGLGSNGQLGDGTTNANASPTPVNTTGVLSGKTVTFITITKNANGNPMACALASGKVYCWGSDVFSQLGDNNTTSQSVPVAVDDSGALAGKTVTTISAGDSYACVIASGKAYCWGYNSVGQIGDGTTNYPTAPVAVTSSGSLAGKTLTSIGAGKTNTCALSSDGLVYCWGSGSYGGLGNGLTSTSTTPVAVSTSGVLSGKTVTNISVGANYACAVASGKAYCWGRNHEGQLGDGTNTDRLTPTAVDTSGELAGKNIITISAGGSSVNGQHTCVTTSDKKIYCWGNGANGMLGNGSSANSAVPLQISSVNYP